MDKKPYTDERWHDNPKPMDSQCNNCRHYHGFAKCKVFPDGIPVGLLSKSIPNTESYHDDYCHNRLTST